ncbi:hypothetical protein OF829_08885 [Sphingomonas sp. LB-2]|uniref:hypothetical protein n=1 Tax=Sphingomonas caeni TaxID=2984949 RepID=UPI002231AEC5|nr:hypothetical protein [Sphingomonas caeni]MCW3847355.1 hypothetical protein [Sphingomonas caeni]
MVKVKMFGAALLGLLASCGSSGSGGEVVTPVPSPTVTPSPTPSPTKAATVEDALKAAQSAGTIPTLDYSDTLLGTDSNANGVRDDIDKYIASLPVSVSEADFLKRKAKALNRILSIDLANADDLRGADSLLFHSTMCIASVPNLKSISRYEDQLVAYTFNTRARFDKYDQFNRRLDGTTIGTEDLDCNSYLR